nr:hypothetical protein 21 [bacterium]
MRKIEDQIAKASILATAVEMGTCEPVDFFANPDMWLNILDGVICCAEIVNQDLWAMSQQSKPTQ